MGTIIDQAYGCLVEMAEALPPDVFERLNPVDITQYLADELDIPFDVAAVLYQQIINYNTEDSKNDRKYASAV